MKCIVVPAGLDLPEVLLTVVLKTACQRVARFYKLLFPDWYVMQRGRATAEIAEGLLASTAGPKRAEIETTYKRAAFADFKFG